jgi:hypothetical protein
MTNDDNDLAHQIADGYSPKLDLADVTAIIEALAALGYSFTPHGVEGRFIDTDEVRHGLVLYLHDQTKLPIQIARHVLMAIATSGLNIREPDQHPSGLQTTYNAFVTVKSHGAGHAAARKAIDTRMPGRGRNYA